MSIFHVDDYPPTRSDPLTKAEIANMKKLASIIGKRMSESIDKKIKEAIMAIKPDAL